MGLRLYSFVPWDWSRSREGCGGSRDFGAGIGSVTRTTTWAVRRLGIPWVANDERRGAPPELLARRWAREVEHGDAGAFGSGGVGVSGRGRELGLLSLGGPAWACSIVEGHGSPSIVTDTGDSGRALEQGAGCGHDQ